jgi:hypothetical protein
MEGNILSVGQQIPPTPMKPEDSLMLSKQAAA